MEFKLSKEHRALQEKAREFTEQVLFLSLIHIY